MATKSIQELYLTNYKKHREFAAKINGNSFILQGGNGAGKSSVLQAIDDLLQTNTHLNAEAQQENPDELVTVGEEEGEAVAVLQTAAGDLVRVTRKFTKRGLGRYELRVKEGDRWQAKNPPKAIFKELFGNVLDLSPLVDMTGAEQIQLIQSILGNDKEVQAEIDKANATIKTIREERLLLGREVKDLKAKMLVPEYRALVNYVGEEPVDLDALALGYVDVTKEQAELNNAMRRNMVADNYIQTLANVQVQDAEIKHHIDEAVRLLAEKRVDVQPIEKRIADATVINEAISDEVENGRRRNALIEQAKGLAADKANLAEKEAKYDEYSQMIRGLLDAISTYTTSASIGDHYPDLEMRYELDDDGKVLHEGVYLRGLPFNRRQQSYGEMVYVLLCISKGLNPNGFNYVKIGDFNLLDAENQTRILELARREDIQLGIEKVDETKEVEVKLIEK
jgi:predicted ATP-dependent endonuclease of OLD family